MKKILAMLLAVMMLLSVKARLMKINPPLPLRRYTNWKAQVLLLLRPLILPLQLVVLRMRLTV